MKKTILPALAMLIVAAVMLSTASYAWFAMGGTVTAENMNVSVKSDSAFLVIAKSEAEIDDDYTETSVSFKNVNDEGNTVFNAIYPVAFNAPDDADFTADDVWYEMVGTSAADGSGTGEQKLLDYDTEVLTDYVLLSTVYIATAKGSENMKNLKATVSINGDDAISVLVVVNGEVYDYITNDATDDVDITGNTLAETVDHDDPIKVDIYVFYDGNHDDITTNNFGLGLIDNTSVSVTFNAINAQ